MMKNLFAIIVCAGLLSMPVSGYSQKHNPRVLNALKVFKQKVGNGFSVSWSKDGSRIIGIELKYPMEETDAGAEKLPSLSKPDELSGSPGETAVAFLKNNSDLFQIPADIPDLRVQQVKDEGDGAYSVRMQQTLNGLPVFDRGITVFMSLNDTRVTLKGIQSVGSTYVPNLNLSTTPLVSEDEVIAIALQETLQNRGIIRDRLGKKHRLPVDAQNMSFTKRPQPELGIYIADAINEPGHPISKEGAPVLVYRFTLTAFQGRVVTGYIIDAISGKILDAGDMRMHAMEKRDGYGDVFWPNPVNTLNDTTLQDLNDDKNAVPLTAYIRNVTLRGIQYDPSYDLYVLCGSYVCMNDLKVPPLYYPYPPLPGAASS